MVHVLGYNTNWINSFGNSAQKQPIFGLKPLKINFEFFCHCDFNFVWLKMLLLLLDPTVKAARFTRSNFVFRQLVVVGGGVFRLELHIWCQVANGPLRVLLRHGKKTTAVLSTSSPLLFDISKQAARCINRKSTGCLETHPWGIKKSGKRGNQVNDSLASAIKTGQKSVSFMISRSPNVVCCHPLCQRQIIFRGQFTIEF